MILKPLLLICLAVASHAAPVSFTWNRTPDEAGQGIIDYVLYELSMLDPTGLPVPIGVVGRVEAPGDNRITIDAVPGVHAYWLTARNSWTESPPSNIATTPPVGPIGAPSGLRITIRMRDDGRAELLVSGPQWALTSIDATQDLRSWQQIYSKVNVMGEFAYLDAAAIGQRQRFYRATASSL